MIKQAPPPLSPAAIRREARREQALRDNLHRRKSQSRGRNELVTPDATTSNTPATAIESQDTTP